MKNLYVTGYRSYEMNIFNSKDEKLPFIKKAIAKQLEYYIDSGLEWVIISGELGTELWTVEVIEELRAEYPDLKIAILFPYYNFGENWNEENTSALEKAKSNAQYVDYTSKEAYQNPNQLKMNQAFIVNHTDGALLLYDKEYEGKPKFALEIIEKRQEDSDYFLDMITMFDLQDIVNQEQFYEEEDD